MMNKKYELTNDSIEYDGVTLYRIKALRDFNNVKAGDLGGYIEKEENLSHERDCCVVLDIIVRRSISVFGAGELPSKDFPGCCPPSYSKKYRTIRRKLLSISIFPNILR